MKITLLLSIFLFIFTSLFTACNNGKPHEVPAKSQPTGHFFFPKIPPETKYKIDCKVEKNGMFHEKIVITFKNTTPTPISQVAFSWSVDEEPPYKVSIKGKILKAAPGYENKTTPPVLFQLPFPVAPGEQVDLNVDASIHFCIKEILNKKNNFPILDWFPKLWWGYETHADYDVKLDIPGSYTITTSGRFDPGTGRWQGKNIRSFGLVIGTGLNVSEDMAGDVLIRVLHTPKAHNCAQLLLATAKDVINFYRERFGFYPYPVLSIIPGISSPAGGYPLATNIVVIHGQEKYPQRGELHWKWITAHEIGHQYFIEYVLEKKSHYWLVIGLGIYADREWMYARDLGNEKHLNFINRFIKGVRRGYNTTAVIHPDVRRTIDFDFNNVVVHGKGYGIIAALDCVLGPETFDRIYKRLLEDYKGRVLGPRDFKAVCEEITNQNLDWFFDQWVYSSRYMSYDIVSKSCEKKEGTEGTYISRIGVKNLGEVAMPVPVKATFTDDSVQVKFTDRFLDPHLLTFESPAPLKAVKIDPDGVLANVVPPPGISANKLIGKIRQLNWYGHGDKARRLYQKALELKLDRGREWFRLALNLYDAKYYNDALTAFQQCAKYAAEEDPSKMGAVVWQGHIMDLLGKRDRALNYYKEALKYAGENSMMHSQYHMIINRQWIEERLKIPFKR
jgi:hypothetical protein